MTDDRSEEPGRSADQVLAGLNLSVRDRVRYILLAIGGLTVAALVADLWATEPDPLPARTHLAFAAITMAGVTWAAFALWALTRRTPLFARDRVIAARLALAFSVTSTAGTTTIAALRHNAAATLTTLTTGLALITAATVLLAAARARHTTLQNHRRRLENS